MTDMADLKRRIKSLQSASREKVIFRMGRCFTSNLTLYMLFRIFKMCSGGLSEMS